MLIPLRINQNNHLRLTMEKIAERVGISRVYLQDLKSGKKSGNLELLHRIAQAMEVKPCALLPIEWQTHTEINPEILARAVGVVLEDAKIKKIYKTYSPEQLHLAMAITYDELVSKNNTLQSKVNIPHKQVDK
jgi:transcriptional regulator with XRE-family HTH domain